jgi:hypothetical protein
MKILLLILPLLLGQEQQIPKNDPNGIWQADSGSQFELRLTGKDLHVKIVPGSNPKFLQYEVDMKNEEEVNTYSGEGFFVAKMTGGKECKFPTQWRLIVVSTDHILGISTNVNADSKTCEIKDQSPVQLELKKKK